MQQLDVSPRRISDKGAEYVAETLRANTARQQLDAHSTAIPGTATYSLSPPPALPSSQSVQAASVSPSQVHPVRIVSQSSQPSDVPPSDPALSVEPRRKKPRPDPSLASCRCGNCIVCDLFARTCTDLRPLQAEAIAPRSRYNPMDDPEASLATPQESDQEEW